MNRLGAVLLPVSVVLFVITTAIFHPHREHPMNHEAVFLEYAQSRSWIAVHLVQWVSAMMLCAGLASVPQWLRQSGVAGGAWVTLALGGTVLTAMGFTMLQAVDGTALKWAVDAWAAAGASEKAPWWSAAMALRWTEYALQSYTNILLGATLLVCAWPLATVKDLPRWVALAAAGSGLAWIGHGITVSYVGLFDSVPRLIAIGLLALCAARLSSSLWRDAPAKAA